MVRPKDRPLRTQFYKCTSTVWKKHLLWMCKNWQKRGTILLRWWMRSKWWWKRRKWPAGAHQHQLEKRHTAPPPRCRSTLRKSERLQIKRTGLTVIHFLGHSSFVPAESVVTRNHGTSLFGTALGHSISNISRSHVSRTCLVISSMSLAWLSSLLHDRFQGY